MVISNAGITAGSVILGTNQADGTPSGVNLIPVFYYLSAETARITWKTAWGGISKVNAGGSNKINVTII